jgi:hypothetical protein
MRTGMTILLAVICLLGITGCPDDVRPAIKTTPPDSSPAAQVEAVKDIPAPKADKDGKVTPLDQAKYDEQKYAELAAKYTALEAQSSKRVEVLTKQAEADAIRAQALWIIGICLILAAICGVAAFIVPLGKKTLGLAAIGFTTVAACARAFEWAVPYLPWIGGTILIGGGIWAALNWKKLGTSTQHAAGYGDRLEEWLKSDFLAALPADLQAKANKVIADVKDATKSEADKLGVSNMVQKLRGKKQTVFKKLLGAVTKAA